jgi:hypothetical protein
MSLHDTTNTSHQQGTGQDTAFSTSAAEPRIPGAFQDEGSLETQHGGTAPADISDNDILNEVNRVEESPGPENPALPMVPVHKYLRGTQGEYEKLDSSAYAGVSAIHRF